MQYTCRRLYAGKNRAVHEVFATAIAARKIVHNAISLVAKDRSGTPRAVSMTGQRFKSEINCLEFWERGPA